MHVTFGRCTRIFNQAGPSGDTAAVRVDSGSSPRLLPWKLALALLVAWPVMLAGQQGSSISSRGAGIRAGLPPRVAQAQRFLARRGGRPIRGAATRLEGRASTRTAVAQSPGAAVWQPLGPAAVNTANYGLVTGRISALALDPADATGNRLFAGTTGGGVWVSQNAATSDPSKITFTPLTDNLAAMYDAPDASISIGALAVQPGSTGVILAGTGDPNDALDSYYGSGILRSTDGGQTWSLIQYVTVPGNYGFLGEGFAGFAWSTVNPQLVVAAVTQAYEGSLVDAIRSQRSYEGMYYSTDSGATWSLAQITDLNGQDVQGPLDLFTDPDGNAATSVVWNPVRNVFIAAVRFHGYYQSTDGAHWTQLAAQPGSGLTAAMCPTRSGVPGSSACPIYRGTLAVNPLTGDTFAWTIDENDQDQGLWQDVCAASGGVCTNQSISFGKQWKTDALQTVTWLGAATLSDGSYNLALAAVPSGQDTILLAGANDLWKCSLAMGCVWRNSTNSATCMSAAVGEYQHALAWNPANPLELFVGNDSGLWRSLDGINESGPVCDASDATHFQNLNGALGSLAEVESMSAVGASPYTMLVGLGANGTAGVKSTTGPTTDWPQILTGEGGPVAIDPANPANWYVNNGGGVSIHLCSQAAPCTPKDFGSTATVTNADVSGDGYVMYWPAPFLVDSRDPSQLLVGTCRVWRGPANGAGWTTANAISPMFDGNRTTSSCSGNALIRSLAAMPAAGGGEVVYAGMYGEAEIGLGATVPGHVFRATMDGNGTWSAWTDVALNPVVNDNQGMNALGMNVSSIYIDAHDPSGNTVYVTIEGVPNTVQYVRMLYRSTDGGAHWYYIDSNLDFSAANSVVVDPQDANTVYVATDAGVFITSNVVSCAGPSTCWSAFGTGLPNAPVVALSAAPPATSPNVLVAGTYGRGVWQIPLATAGVQLTSASISPGALDFGSQGFGSTSSPKTVTLTNTGAIALIPGAITINGDFSETDNCAGETVNAGASCTIQVTFRPAQAGSRSGQLSVAANIPAGNLLVALTGTGEAPGVISLTPTTVDFGQVKVGTTSRPISVTAENSGESAVSISSVTVSGPFVLATNSCGSTSFAGDSDCQLQLEFAPAAAGATSGSLTIVDAVGTQSVQLTGTGAAPPTDTLSATSLTFGGTILGQTSAAQTVTLTNSGDLALNSIDVNVTGPFQVSNNCTTVLAAHSSCSLAVVFAPAQSGAQTGTVTIADGINTGQTVALSGIGLTPPAFTVSPTSVTFPTQPVGSASQPATLKVTNSGGAAAANVGFQITGPAAGSFSTGTTNCGANLASGASCSIQVLFTPASTGGAAATLTISSSTVGVNPITVSLSGTGQNASGLNVSPTQLSFPAQQLNQPSATQIVTVTNAGSTTATGLSMSMSGPFSLAQNNCGSSLAAGASCTTGIVFTPQMRGALTGMLTVTAANLATPATVALSGIGGLTGAVQVTPSLVNFPTTGVGSRSSPVAVTIANSSAAVELDNLHVFTSAGFQLGNTTCEASLQAGAGCTVAVLFAPTAAGAQSGTLTLTSDELAANVTVPLSGMGFDFGATASGAASQTVSSGQTANYTLSVSNTSGASGTFSMQCGTLPSYATCVFNPSSATVAANGTGTVSLQITTSQASSAATPAGMGGWGAMLPLLAVVFLPLAVRRRRGVLMVVAGFVAISVAGFTACSSSGGGGGSSAPPPVTHTTPAGTYTIPVTVSSIGVQHTVTVTLVVD